MTYDTNLAEPQQGAIPEFFEFTSGSTIERYTTWTQDTTFLGSEFIRAHVKRSRLKQDTSLGMTSLRITAPVSAMFTQYIASAPVEPIHVKVYRAIESDLSDYVTLFEGYIKSLAIESGVATGEAETRSDILAMKLPKYVYQAYCNHEVFDGGCGLIDTNFRVTGTVYQVTGAEIRCTAFNAYSDNYFKGGKVQYGTDWRLITSHTGNIITINIAFSGLAIDDTVYAFPGCARDGATCWNKYSNGARFLGMPYIPSRNPAIWGFH